MEKKLPRINFDTKRVFDIEVMTLKETFSKLENIDNHDPYKSHKIKFYLILYVTKDAYEHYVDFKYYNLTAGSILFIAKNQVHHFTKKLELAEGYCIVLNSNFLEKRFFLSENIKLNRLYNYHLENPAINGNEIEEDGFSGLIRQLYKEYTNSELFAKKEILSTLLHLFLLKAERVQQKRSFTQIKTNRIVIFNKFIESIENEYSITRSSRYYASKLTISYKLLNEIVKELTKKTVKEFIDDFVTVEIKRYLVSTSLSIKEISYKTGFDEPSNMVKFFKRNTLQTPIQFRNKI